MRLIAFVIIAISLTLGAIAATTAYVPKLEAVAPVVQAGGTVTLAAPAGARTDDTATQPLVPSGTVLSPELVAMLEAANVKRVRIKEFAFDRWPLAWLFGVSVVGLLLGAGMVRLDRRRRIAAEAEGTEGGAAAGEATSAAAAISAIRGDLARLGEQLARTPDPQQRQHLVTSRLGETQGTHIDAFLTARDRLIGRYGLSGFAQIMDRFAAMERQINRAWSAAADGVLEEAEECVARALALVDDVEAAMRR